MRNRVRAAGAVRPTTTSATIPAIPPHAPRPGSAWRRDLRQGTAFAALFAFGLVSAMPAAHAQDPVLPTGGAVTHGDAAISGSGSGLLIEQTSASAIINWNTFSIGAGASTHFSNGAGATLNRVGGNVPTTIDGALTATGSLFLVNPAGVTVGSDGMVATGGTFAASTHDVTDADFLDGGDTVFAGDSKAQIVNHGTISSAMGDVALIARRVENTGEISAPNGTAALLAGYDVLMHETTGPNGKFVVRAGGSDTEVVNSGTINAAEVELRANGGNVLALAGNTKGVVKATGVAKRGGRIFLTAGGGKVQAGGRVVARRRVASGSTQQAGGEVFVNADTVLASGHIDVSGLGASGGAIDIGGRDIALEGAHLDASGTTGGGRIRVGGEYQGGKDLASDEVENAETLLIDAASVLRADGTGDGADGGTVIAWADDTTTFEGFISATGSGDGNGGFAEVSGKRTLSYSGFADLRSDTGATGMLLLDPTDFVVDAGGDITGAALGTQLDAANVIISSDDGGTGTNGDVIFNESVTWTSGNSLTVTAVRGIDVNAAISGNGDISLFANGFEIDADVDAGTEVLTIGRTVNEAIFLGTNGPIDQARFSVTELGHLHAGSLIFGNPDSASNLVTNIDLVGTFDFSTNISGPVHFNALFGDGADITLSPEGSLTGPGPNYTFAATEFNANGAFRILADGSSITTNSGGVGINADADASGTGSGVFVRGVNDGSIVSAADIDIITNEYNVQTNGQLVLNADSGTGNISIGRASAGTIGVGTGAGGDFNLSDDELGDWSAGSVQFGDITHTTGVLVDGGDYTTFSLGDWSVVANSGGTAEFTDNTENYTFESLSVTAGSVLIGANITATANTLTFNAPVLLTTDTMLTDGGNVTFNDTVDSASTGFYDLTIDADGTTTFAGKVGGTRQLDELDVDSDGGINVNGGLVATTGNQTYQDQVSVAGTVFAATGAAADLNLSAGITTLLPNNDVWFLAADDVDIRGDIQWDGTGNVTLVAGWNAMTDGSTGWSMGDDFADTSTLMTTGNFGLGNGAIFIGDGAQTAGIAVGSRGGTTTALARDLFLTASAAAGGDAQFGFRGVATDAPIDVRLTGNLIMNGGSGNAAYAQIGHGGNGSTGAHSGAIDVSLDGYLQANAGSGDYASVQIGHGGYGSVGSQSGAIEVTVGDFLDLFGGSGDNSYAQIGHGGHSNVSGVSGAITVDIGLSGEVAGGGGEGSYSQIGHGGLGLIGGASGNIDVISGTDLLVRGSTDFYSYGQIGHGGYISSGDFSGDILLDIGDDLTVQGGSVADSYAQIGHGDASGTSNRTREGNISAVVDGLTAFTDESSLAWFGHATTTDGGVSSANVALVTNGLNTTGIPLVTTGVADFAGMLQYNLLGGNVLIANRLAAATPDAGGFANQGFDDIIFTGPNFGYFTSGFDLTLAAGGDVVMLSSVQNQGDGGLNLIGGWDGATGLDLSGFPMLDADAVETAGAFGVTGGDVYVGDGSQTQDVRVGSRQGDIHVLAHDLEVRGSLVSSGDGARLGYRAGPIEGIDSDIRVAVMDDVIVEGGSEDFTPAAIGHDNVESDGEINGDITILGETANDNVLAVLGGSGDSSYAQIGHEGCCAALFGNIAITGEDVIVQGGTNIFAEAQIGHYWDEATGNITINASGLFDVIGGDAPATYATVGHIADDSATGDINITVGMDSLISGGGVFESDAQVGHYGGGQAGSLSGAINLNVGGNLDIWGGFDEDTAAYVGHAGIGGSASGAIDVDVGDVLTLWGGDDEDSWAQIGHSINAGSNSGQIDVNAGVLDLLGGGDPEAYAQIGHGDAAIDHSGTREGDINVIVDGEATLEDGAGGGLAWIGHGTTTAGGTSNADVFLQAFGFDRTSASTVAAGGLGSINKDIIESDIPSGNFTMIATGTGIQFDDPVYNSPFQFLAQANNDIVLNTNAFFVNSGTGDIILAAGGDFHNDTGSLTPFTTGGRWLVYSTRPDNNRNDIEITDWDFLRYATTFDFNNPLLGSGDGLIYSVAPVVNFTVSSETITYGQTVSPTLTQTLTVNGVQVDADAFGLGINPATAQAVLATSVTLDAAGNPVTGFHNDGLTTGSESIPYLGMSFTTTPGDLTVNGSTVDPVDDEIDGAQTTTAYIGIGEMCAFRSDDEDPEEEGPSYDRIIELCGIIESDTD